MINTQKTNIVVGVSGASGMPYARRLLECLRNSGNVVSHVILTEAARAVLSYEAKADESYLTDLADVVYGEKQIAASPASGSWRHMGMVICPCSMNTLAGVAHGTGSNLLLRSADVCLKERKPLVLVTRETPLNRIHIRNMLEVTDAGGTIMPACPGFYNNPQSMDDIVDFMVARIFDHFGIPQDLAPQWQG